MYRTTLLSISKSNVYEDRTRSRAISSCMHHSAKHQQEQRAELYVQQSDAHRQSARACTTPPSTSESSVQKVQRAAEQAGHMHAPRTTPNSTVHKHARCNRTMSVRPDFLLPGEAGRVLCVKPGLSAVLSTMDGKPPHDSTRQSRADQTSRPTTCTRTHTHTHANSHFSTMLQATARAACRTICAAEQCT